MIVGWVKVYAFEIIMSGVLLGLLGWMGWSALV